MRLYLLFTILFIGIQSYGQKGPGGVSGGLVLWLDPTEISGNNNQVISSWVDKSPSPVTLSGYNSPVLKTNSVNGLNSFYFNASSQYFEAPKVKKLKATNFTVFTANAMSETRDYGAIFSNRGHQLYGCNYSYDNYNYWGYSTCKNRWGAYDNIYSETYDNQTWTSQTMVYDWTNYFKSLYVNNVLTTSGTCEAYFLRTPFRVGFADYGGSYYFFKGYMGEVIMYDKVVNSAERTIVNNYLSAKYGFALSSMDYYKMDDVGYDSDVTGIGRDDYYNQHLNSTGTGIISISRSYLSSGEYLFTGSNRENTEFNNYNKGPVCYICMDRIWGVTNRGGIWDVNLSFQFTINKPSDVPERVYIIVDRNKNGIYSDEAPIESSSQTASTIYFNNIQLKDGETFTLAVKAIPIATDNISRK